jgi:hypothetical protein
MFPTCFGIVSESCRNMSENFETGSGNRFRSQTLPNNYWQDKTKLQTLAGIQRPEAGWMALENASNNKFQKSFGNASKRFRGGFGNVWEMFQKWFRHVSDMFQTCFIKFRKCFRNVSEVFQTCTSVNNWFGCVGFQNLGFRIWVSESSNILKL